MIRTKINILQLFHAVVNRINVDYAALFGWDFNNCNVTVRGMLIPDALLTKEIHATDDYKEYETMFINVAVLMNQPQPVVSTQRMHMTTPRAQRTPTLTTASPQGKKRKLEPGSHKDKPENVDDDDDKYDEKVDEKEGGETGSLETKTDKMQTPIPTPPRSPRTILSSDKNITHELTETVHFAGCVDVNATEELIENNLKPCIAATIIEDRDAFRSEVPDLVSQEFNAQAPKIIEDLFKNYVQINVIQVHPTTTTSSKTTSSADLQQLYFKMKRSLQDRANDLALWEVMKRKFEKSPTTNTSCRDDDIHSHHDDHQDNDAPPEG
ncbi:hypothetical protein Tco_1382776, partial [Tanacetum coccineum]